MKFWVILAFFGVAACDSPHPRMMNSDAKVITVEGSTFSVRVRGDIAEAIRTNWEPRREHGRILARAVVAIEETTGCDVRQNTLKGDPALVAAKIRCPTGDAPS